MTKIEQIKIRRIYYTGTLLIIMAMVFLISIPFYLNIQRELTREIQQLEQGILNQKKLFLKEIVYEKISDIENLHIWMEQNLPELTDSEFEIRFRKNVIGLIHNTSFSGNEYIWINEIINYEGGDNYAIRFVHPNLPETEGNYLSTNTKDIKGNRPYLDELEGIKKNGEVYLDYYFKKLNSNEISHKLSFGKLFEKYNWVILTGVYLDDIDSLIHQENEMLKASSRYTAFRIFTILITAIIVLVFLIKYFEYRIQQMINSYMANIESSNKKLLMEKQKLQEAYEKIENLAFHDPMTGLLNRRSMYNYLTDEYSRFCRGEIPFGLLLCDIDFFKKINDNYGHPAGDYVIKELSRLLQSQIRSEDKLCRWGGEEFLCLITNTDSEKLVNVAEKLRKAVEKKTFIWKENRLNITITIGAVISDNNTNLEYLINYADKNLYRGKKQGRNQVVYH